MEFRVGGLDFHVGGTTDGTVSFSALLDSVDSSSLGPFSASDGGSVSFSGDDTLFGTGEVLVAAYITHTAGGQSTSFDIDFHPIPESATMILLGTGLVGVAGAARRRKKNQA